MTDGKNADDRWEASGSHDRQLGEVRQEVREIRIRVDDVAATLYGLVGEWRTLKWVFGAAMGFGALLIAWLSWLASGSGGGG